ncbi:gamma-glutamyltransferase [Vibrio chagasii]|nr:gamma-glutamyltransferase [Vibrio chagasii]
MLKVTNSWLVRQTPMSAALAIRYRLRGGNAIDAMVAMQNDRVGGRARHDRIGGGTFVLFYQYDKEQPLLMDRCSRKRDTRTRYHGKRQATESK